MTRPIHLTANLYISFLMTRPFQSTAYRYKINTQSLLTQTEQRENAKNQKIRQDSKQNH